MVEARLTLPTGVRSDVSRITALAWPLILTNFAYVALTTLDIVFLSALGPADLAAGGLALALLGQLRAMGNGLVTGIGNLVAGDREDAAISGLVSAGFLLSSLAAIPFIALALSLEKPLIWLGQDPAVAARAVHFMVIAALGLLPCMWFETLRHFTSGMKQPGPLLAITLISAVLSAVLNYAFALGGFGFPKLGLTGVALTTALVPLLSFLMLAFAAKRRPALGRYLSFAAWRADRRVVLRIWRLGLPIAATYGSEAGFFSALTLLIGTLGVSALAAQTVVNQAVYIVFMVSSGISYAVSIYISEAISQADFTRARRLSYTGLALGLLTMAVVAVPYLTMPNAIITLVMGTQTDLQPGTVELAAGGLAIAALLQVFDCSQSVANGSLRGAGDTASPFKLSLLGYWFLGLPAAYVLGIALRFGVYGVWSGLTLGLAATTVLLMVAFETRLERLES